MLRTIIILSLAGLTGLPCLAQAEQSKPSATESLPKSFYQLSFVLQEVEGEKVMNTRSYSMIVQGAEQSSIRAGEKVPFSSTSDLSTQWQQIDVGVNIDAKSLEVNGSDVSLYVKAEVSSVREKSKTDGAPNPMPTIRQDQWNSRVVLPVKRPTVVFSSDHPDSKGTMRLQLTVTPIR